MKTLFKRYVCAFVSIACVVLPVELLAAEKAVQSASYSPTQPKSYVKKVNAKRLKFTRVKASKTSLARSQRIAKQRAIELGENYDGRGLLQLASSKALIINQNTGEVIYAKNTNVSSPIASITKLMTAMVMLDAKQSLDETIYISDQDVDYIKNTHSRLSVGNGLKRSEMLQLALMASENRAASSMATNYPGGQTAFVKAMNAKALSLGLYNTHFEDPTGLNSANVSTAEDLAKMVQAAYQYPEIREATTSASHEVYFEGRANPLNFNNTNGLVRAGQWDIGLSKTGFINEAGRCLVMQAMIAGEPMIVVLLDSNGKLTRIGDANRVRKWVEHNLDTPTVINPNTAEELPTVNGSADHIKPSKMAGTVS